ncbi:hypothetical protein EON66_12055, partial [archaeon]
MRVSCGWRPPPRDAQHHPSRALRVGVLMYPPFLAACRRTYSLLHTFRCATSMTPPPPPHEFDAVTSAAHREGPHRACVRYAVDQSLVGAGGSYSRPPAFIVVPGLVCGWKNHIVVDLPFGIASKLCNCSILAMAKGKGGGVTHVSFLSELTLHYDPHVEDTPRGYESYTVREVCQHIHWLGKRAPIRPVWLRVLLDWDDGTTDMFECAPTYYRTDVVAGTALCSLRHNLVDEY